MKAVYFAGLAALLLGIVACEPVFAIGWRELGIILLLAAIVFGPPVYRVLRRMEKYWKTREK
ncbi:MAG: hypothetical protein ACM3XO_09840 [Bacteroidota bacterium]